jgi:hypothetical protein
MRSLTVLILCLAFLGTRVTGLHFHVSEGHEHTTAAASHHEEHADHPGSHLTSDFAIDHFSGHAVNDEFDAGGDAAPLAKLSSSGLPILFVLFWLAFALASSVSAGKRIPVVWLRPPPLRRWPTLLLPPSQGPPRAI